jgi:uncharacterized protein YycO
MDKFRRFLFRILKPITMVLGHIHFSPKERDIKAHDVMNMFSILQTGDVLLSYTKGELTNTLIDGEYKHCGIYTGQGVVVEAVGHGVRAVTLEEFAASKDKIAICRPLFALDAVCSKAADIAVEQIGKPYDYGFEPNEEAFYCAELVAFCYNKATDGATPFVPREVMGVATVLPVDYKLAKSKFKTVAEVPA